MEEIVMILPPGKNNGEKLYTFEIPEDLYYGETNKTDYADIIDQIKELVNKQGAYVGTKFLYEKHTFVLVDQKGKFSINIFVESEPKSKKKKGLFKKALAALFVLLTGTSIWGFAMYKAYLPIPQFLTDYTVGWWFKLDDNEAKTVSKLTSTRYVLMNSPAKQDFEKLQSMAINGASNEAIEAQFHTMFDKLDNETITAAAAELGLSLEEVQYLVNNPTDENFRQIEKKVGIDRDFLIKFGNENLNDIKLH